MADKPLPYRGRFPTPNPEALKGALGWRHIKESVPGENRWTPTGFMIVFPDHILFTNMDGFATRVSVLHSVDI